MYTLAKANSIMTLQPGQVDCLHGFAHGVKEFCVLVFAWVLLQNFVLYYEDYIAK